MELMGYRFDFDNAIQSIINNKYHTVAVQLPEGLKQLVFPLVDYLKEHTQARILVVADPCFGACDIANYELKNLDVDCVIQIGHAPIPDVENFWIPTFFVNAYSMHDPSQAVEKALPFLEGKRIGVVTTAQHLHMLEHVKNILQSHHLEPVIGTGDERLSVPGQILGCNFTTGTSIAAQVDSFLFIGSGLFHPLGLILSTKKPVVAADPYTSTVKTHELDELKDSVLRQRYGAITAAKAAKTYGILIGLKRGQQRLSLAYEIQSTLESAGRKTILVALDEIVPNSVTGFLNVDCYVSTACPRLALDDYLMFKKPIITPVEVDIMLGKRSWDEYGFDQILSE